MADPPAHDDPDTGEDPVEPDRGSTAGTPRWVKVAGIIAVVLLLLVAVMLMVGGNHGPGRHLGGGDGPSGQPTGHAGSPAVDHQQL